MPAPNALWYVAKDSVELRPAGLAPAASGEVVIRALYSGLSRGTERLVLRGAVPRSEWERMRCPHQEGAFPFPVKYGYALVGEIEEGPARRLGETVFLLHPHQERAVAPGVEAHPLPDGLPPRRAVLAANMETALTVLWDSGVSAGDRVLVVGAGVLGLLIAAVAARVPGTEVLLTDIEPSRADVAAKLGCGFVSPETAPGENDVVVHASASEAGLRLALEKAGQESTVVEASWYGQRDISLPLGEAFHSRRLRLVSSQVGSVPAGRAPRWTPARRLGKALALLVDDAFDCLITAEIPFALAPKRIPEALAEGGAGLMTVLRYS